MIKITPKHSEVATQFALKEANVLRIESQDIKKSVLNVSLGINKRNSFHDCNVNSTKPRAKGDSNGNSFAYLYL